MDESDIGTGQAKSPTIRLAPGKVLQSRLAGKLAFYSPGVTAGVHVPVSLREANSNVLSFFSVYFNH